MSDRDVPLRRIDHVRLFVGNARQSAYFYRNAFGFDVVAYEGLETGVKHEAGYVLRQGKITFVLTSSLRANDPDNMRLMFHGDGVKDIAEFTIGYDGIILAGSAKRPAFPVTRAQMWLAVAKTVPVNGKWVANPYTNWHEVDPSAPSRPIRVFGPAPNHGTRDAFVEMVMDPACGKAPETAPLSADDKKRICSQVREDGHWTDVSEDYALIMGKLAGDADALGAFTFSYLEQNRDKLHASTVDGVAASEETIASGKYPISRPLFIYVKKAHVGVIPGGGAVSIRQRRHGVLPGTMVIVCPSLPITPP